MYLFDTNACIRLLNRTSNKLISRIHSEDPANIFLCSITKAELFHGARHSARVAANLKLLERFLEPYISLPFDDVCAEMYGTIRAELTSKGSSIGPYDLHIAATARAHNLILISHNTKEFSRVPGLRLEDWD